jgi:predicted double-glycine peptidase
MQLQTTTGTYSIALSNWRDLPFRSVVRQQYDFSCGSAAVATLLSYHYGRATNEAEVFETMFELGDQERIRQRGFSLLDMQRYLASENLPADGYRMPLDQLLELETPAITMIQTGNYRHFVVIKGARGDRVLVGDPALGLTVYQRDQFEQIWQGVAFVIHGEGVGGAFNRDDEWRIARPPRWSRLPAPRALEPLTRELPPLYQITPVVTTP